MHMPLPFLPPSFVSCHVHALFLCAFPLAHPPSSAPYCQCRGMYVHTQAYTCTRVIGHTQIKQDTTSATNQAPSAVISHCDHHRAEQTNGRLSKRQIFRKHTQAHTYGHMHTHTHTYTHGQVVKNDTTGRLSTNNHLAPSAGEILLAQHPKVPTDKPKQLVQFDTQLPSLQMRKARERGWSGGVER